MPSHLFFYIGLSLMVMHEMDAMRCKEWRIFPGLSLLSDSLGQKVFLWAHLPLFTLLFRQLSNPIHAEALIFGFNHFMIIHLGLHLLFLKHPNNMFKDLLSWSIIAGAGLCGLLDLTWKY